MLLVVENSHIKYKIALYLVNINFAMVFKTIQSKEVLTVIVTQKAEYGTNA